jgi:hypothetical protein
MIVPTARYFPVYANRYILTFIGRSLMLRNDV